MKYLFIFLVLTGCSSSYHLKKAERQIKRAEAKGAKWKIDTVFSTVSLKVQPLKVQFTPKPLIYKDTIYFEKEKVVTKVFTKEGKTIYVETDCPERIIERKVPVTVVKTIEAKIPITWGKFILWVFIAFVLGAVLMYLAKTFGKFMPF
jgi:hypothetical protein